MRVIVITPAEAVENETVVCNLLFASGLEVLHLRKPGAGREAYERFVRAIEPRYRERIVVHEHYDLAKEYGLRGVHLKARDMGRMSEFAGKAVSFSCHSVEEAEGLPEGAAYCFLSPVFDSISKAGYRSAFAQMPDLSGCRVAVVALGGITAERADACRRAGFAGMAVLGYLWEKPEEAVMRFRRLRTPFVMSVAGFDPSSGAGVSADLKTFEATGSYGLGVCTSITFQNEDTYAGTHWLAPEEIVRQCEMQLRHHEPEYVKIGLVESFEALDEVTRWLREHCPGCRIVWDPILKASAGHVFHAEDTGRLNQVLPRLYLVTPNTEEVYRLFGQGATAEKVQRLCRQHGLHVLWKGGHNEGEESTDCLITPEKVYRFTLRKSPYAKHGTGCMLSAALLSHLAQGDDLPTACNKAQVYVGQVIESNDSLLGYTPRETGTLPRPEELRVQYITAPKAGMTLAEQAEAVCRGGMRWVQLRMKGAATEEFLETGRLVKAVCHRYGSLFIVNDNVQAARQLDADGVHLGKEDMPPQEAREWLGKGKIIGATCNTWEDILLRSRQGVDYIGLGPYTFTTTKEKLSPVLGVEGYRRLLEKMRQHGIRIPVFAIGGITEADMPALAETGIQGFALSGVIKNSADLCSKTREIIRLLNQYF